MGPSVAVLDQMVFTVDAKEQEPAMDEIKEMLAALAARMDALEAAVADKYDGDKPEEPAKDEDPAKTEEPAEDEDEPATADPEPAKDEDPVKAMDAVSKRLDALDEKLSRVVVLDEAAVFKTLARKTSLAERLAAHVGTFDHSSMTFDAVVKYGVEKLGLKDIPKGAEAVALDAALQVRAVPTPHSISTDGKKSALSASLAEYTGV